MIGTNARILIGLAVGFGLIAFAHWSVSNLPCDGLRIYDGMRQWWHVKNCQ